MEIPLTQGLVALVDDGDYERCASVGKWRAASPNGTHFYAIHNTSRASGQKRTTIQMHRLILDASRGTVVDHISGDGLDNRRSNLRLCTHAQNSQNRKPWKGSSSRFLGVYLQKTAVRYGCKRVWAAAIGRYPTKRHLGTFETEVEAALAYDCAAREWYGEFARPNFPENAGHNVA